MTESIVAAIIAGCFAMIGTFAGIIKANELTNYRIKELEKKVDKHNNFAERMPLAEKDIKLLQKSDEKQNEKLEEHDKLLGLVPAK